MKLTVFHDTRDSEGKKILRGIKSLCGETAPETVFYDLNENSIEPCCGCFSCWVKTPGICIYKDMGAQYLKEMVQSDRILFLCPVTWGGCSSPVKIAMDRSLGRVFPFFIKKNGETHHSQRYERVPSFLLAGYGESIEKKEEALFLANGRNYADNMGGKSHCTLFRSEDDLSQIKIFLGGGE